MEALRKEMEWLGSVFSNIIFLFLYVFCWARTNPKRPPPGSRLPPSPPGTPFIGHVQLRQPFFYATTAIEWAKSFGPIYSIRTGLTEIYIASRIDEIKKLFSKDELSYRSKAWRLSGLDVGYPLSLEGDAWVTNRRFCLRALKDLGFARLSMWNAAASECEHLIKAISDAKGRPIAIEELLLPSISNNTIQLIFGERYSFDDPTRKWLDDTLRKTLGAAAKSGRFTALGQFKNPRLNRIAFSGRENLEKSFKELGEFTRSRICARMSLVCEEPAKTLIDAYIKAMLEYKNGSASHYSVPNLTSTAIGFFQAASAGVPSYLHWHMLNFARLADTLQAQVQDEIDSVVGPDRLPEWEDSRKMPFTMAVIWEMLRWKAITPLSVPRRAGVDFVSDGIFFPAGVTVMANFWAVHNDPNRWPNPEDFDPTRFLHEDGSATVDRPEHILSFSLGPRKCPAETQAIMLMFLYIVCILRDFRVLPEEGVAIDPGDKLNRLPAKDKYLLRFVPRARQHAD